MADEDRELSYPERDRTEVEAGEEQAEQKETPWNDTPDTRPQQEMAARNAASIMETLRQIHGGMEQEKKDRERAEQNARQGDYFCLAPVR